MPQFPRGPRATRARGESEEKAVYREMTANRVDRGR